MENTEIIQVGYLLAKGFAKYMTVLLAVIIATVCCLNFARWVFGIGVDDSDLSTWKRSDMKVYTDYKTGVQYLGTTNGLTVRVDRDGRPIVVEVNDD